MMDLCFIPFNCKNNRIFIDCLIDWLIDSHFWNPKSVLKTKSVQNRKTSFFLQIEDSSLTVMLYKNWIPRKMEFWRFLIRVRCEKRFEIQMTFFRKFIEGFDLKFWFRDQLQVLEFRTFLFYWNFQLFFYSFKQKIITSNISRIKLLFHPLSIVFPEIFPQIWKLDSIKKTNFKRNLFQTMSASMNQNILMFHKEFLKFKIILFYQITLQWMIFKLLKSSYLV